jgi:uncharacterized protein YdeI (YjbR/CyaY-like superfamily)
VASGDRRAAKDPLVQLRQAQAARVMKFTSAKEILAKAATIKAYVKEAMTAALCVGFDN